jgi:hypothetical protein
MFPPSTQSRHAAFVQGWSVNEFKPAPLTPGARLFSPLLVIPSGLLSHYQTEI